MEVALANAFSRLARFEWREPGTQAWEIGRWPGWFLALLAQPEYGNYRADLAITTWVYDDDGLPPFIVVIEVDGHDYHERTKEQAEYDKRRDRFMTRTNAKVFRFTGREVWRDADACAYEVFEFVVSLQQPYLDREFKRFLKRPHD